MTCFDKPVYAQKHPYFGSQIWCCFESEYVQVYRGLGGLAPQGHGLWRIIRAIRTADSNNLEYTLKKHFGTGALSYNTLKYK
jgi:hypothetical protein